MNIKPLRPRPHKSPPAFTLIKLLVVISIISLLLAILLPALGRARKSVRKVVCLTNVRRLSISMRLYLDASREYFPPDRLRNQSEFIVIGPYRRYRPRWIWFLSEGMGYVINPYKYSTETEFNSALEMDNDYFLCPSLKDQNFARSIRNGAYGLNFQYLANTRTAPSGTGSANYPNKFSRVRVPNQTIGFGDSRGANIPHGEHAYCMDPPKMAYSRGARHFSPKNKAIGPLKYSPADARHLGKANLSYLDGHAESMQYEDIGYLVDPATGRPIEKQLTDIGGPGNNTLWTGTGQDEPDVP